VNALPSLPSFHTVTFVIAWGYQSVLATELAV
jgi:hypothetical protein